MLGHPPDGLCVKMVRAAGIEPALLSEQDFELGEKHTNVLIYLCFNTRQCASVLINVLI